MAEIQNLKTKKWTPKLLLLSCIFYLGPVQATSASPFIVTNDDQTINIADDFIYNEIINDSFVNTTIIVDTSLSNEGLLSTGISSSAISFSDSATLAELTITSGTVSSGNADSSSGTVSLIGDDSSSPVINVGQNSGASGTIKNTASGNAIYAEGGLIDLTINNKATGTISSNGTAINLYDSNNLSSLTLNNAGAISGVDYAIYLDGYSATITNSGNITGNIYVSSNSALTITNTAGTITGDIDLGINSSSSVNLNGGTIAGDVIMRNDDQLFVFNGGNLNGGSIDGYSGTGTAAGTVRVDANTTLHGFIGKNNPVSLLEISDGTTFNFNGNSSRVSKISIGAATLNDTYGDIDTDEIDGSSAGVGIFNLTFPSGGTITYTTPTGTTNGLEQFNITANPGSNPANAATVILDESIKVGITKIEGTGGVLRLAAGNTATGDVEIGEGATFQLDDGSSVTGTIQGTSQYQGTLVIRHTSVNPAAVSSVTLNDDVGGGTHDLFSMIGEHNTITDAATNNVAINAQNIYLYSLANLQLGTGTVTGDIKGKVDSGSSNGFGDVTFTDDNTLGGNVGSSNGNALNSVTVNAGKTVTAGSHEINATTISIGDGAALTTAGLISGGDNDDSGATLKDTAISIGDSSTLTLNDGASLYGSINSTGSDSNLTIDTTLDSSNSHINIGNSAQLGTINLSDNAVLDVTSNNGTVKADAISIGDNATLKLGNAEITGTVDGSANDKGTLDVQGNVTLDGIIGDTHPLHLVNIGAADSDGFSVTAHDSIAATSTTINGSGTSLSMDADKAINGDVVIGDGAELSLGDGSVVNGTIKGDSQYQGILTIRSGATVSAGGDIGTGSEDLAKILIHGTLDLSGLSEYEAHAQVFSLTNGASLVIGSGVVEGDIKGLGSGDGGVSHGIGKGSVSFVANNSSFAGTKIGSADGHAIAELSVAELLMVDTGSADINATRIMLYAGADLTSSAGSITGGDGISGGLTRLATQITLNDGASLTLNNVDTFIGTIDGNNSGEGSLTLTGSYHSTEGDDSIDIGGTKKLASITLDDSSSLDVSDVNGTVKASAITLNDGATLTVGEADIVGTVNGDSDGHGTLTILGDAALHGEIGGSNYLSALNIGASDTGVAVTANESIAANNITLAGNFTTLTMAASKSITGEVTLGSTTRLNLNDSAYVDGEIHGAAQYNGELNILANSWVVAGGNIGAGGKDLASVGINGGARFDLATNDVSMNAQSISLIDNSELVIGSATVTGDILGYGTGGSTVAFAGNTHTMGGNIGNDSGNAVNLTIVGGGGISMDTNGFSIYSSHIIIATGSSLTASGTIAGSLDGDDNLTGTSLNLNANTTLTLDSGASFFGTINSADNIIHKGAVNIADNVAINSDITIGNINSIVALHLGDSSSLDLSAHNNTARADLISLEDGATLILGTGSVTGNIVGYAGSGSSNGLGNIVFAGATNSLAGNLGGHNDNAVGNVTINTANSVAAGSHEINASTITLEDYATLSTSGAISGGADITGTSPIATAITLNANSLLVFNSGSSLFGTIDGVSDGVGTVEFTSDFTTNGNIGSAFKLASVIVDDNVSLDLSTNSNSINAATVYIGNDSILVLGGGGAVHAAIASLTGDSGVLYLNDSAIMDSGSTLGGDSGLLTLYIDHAAAGNVVVDSHDSIKAHNININGVDSQLNLSANETITGNITLGDGTSLNLTDGDSVTGSINASSAHAGGLGTVGITGDVVINGDIGSSNKIAALTIDNNSSLDASDSTIINAANITLGSNSGLTVGTTALNSAIDGSNNDSGTLTITSAETATTHGNIGASKSLHAVNINSGAILDLATNGNSLDATTTTLGIGATLNVGSGAILGSFTGSGDGDGTIVFKANQTVNGSVALGTTGHSLNTITIDNGVVITLSNAPQSSLINVGTTGSSASSLNITTSGTDTIGDVSIAANGTLNLSSSGFITSGAINGKTDNAGTLTLSGGGTLTLTGDIGSTHPLSAIHVNDNYLLNAFSGSASVIATDIYLAAGAGIAMGNGTLSGTVHGSGNSDSISFLGGASHMLYGNLGVASDAAGVDSVTIQGALNAGTHGIRTNDFIFDSTSAVLNLGSGNIDITAFTNNNAGSGIINFNSSNNLNFVIDSANAIAELNISNGATLNANQDIHSANTTIGSGTSGKLILAANRTLSSDVQIENGANLTLNNNSAVSGDIIGAGTSGTGTIEIASSASVTAAGDIGTSANKISTIALDANSTLDLGSFDVVANNVSLNNGSLLKINSGSFNTLVSGSSNGFGTANFTDDNSLLQNIGTSSNKLSSVTIDNGKTLTSGSHAIYANNVSLGAGSNLDLQNGAHVTSDINGNLDHHGTVFFDGTQTVDGNIGNTHPLADLDVATGANIRVNGNVAADSYDLQGKFHINGTFSGDLTVASGGEFGGNNTLTGDLTLSNGSKLAPGNSVGTVNVTGNVTFNSGSTYQVELAGTQSDRLNATGNITIDPNVTLELVPLATVTGSSFTFLHSNTSLTGTFDNLITNGLDATVGYTTTDGMLNVTVFTASPDAINTQAQASLQTAGLFADTVHSAFSSDAFSREDNYWIKAIYGSRKRDAVGLNTGFQNNIDGTAMGAEYAIEDNWKFGFSLANLENHADMDNALGKTKGNSNLASVYGTYAKNISPSWDAFTTLGALGGYYDYDNSRLVSNSGVTSHANSDSNGYEAGALFQVGLRKAVNDWYLAPSVGADYIHVFANGYNEHSGGAAAVSMNDYDFGTIRPQANLSLYNNKGIALPYSDIIMKPSLNIGAYSEYAMSGRDASGTFSTGTPFNLTLDKSNSTFATGSINLDFDIKPGVTAFTSYQSSINTHESRNDVQIGIKLKY